MQFAIYCLGYSKNASYCYLWWSMCRRLLTGNHKTTLQLVQTKKQFTKTLRFKTAVAPCWSLCFRCTPARCGLSLAGSRRRTETRGGTGSSVWLSSGACKAAAGGGQGAAPASFGERAAMFRIEGLAPKLDPEEMKRKMREDVISSIRNFLIYVALLRVSECPLGLWP